MSDPKKLVPPCDCPPQEDFADILAHVLKDKREFQRRPIDLLPPTPLQAALKLAQQQTGSTFVTLQEITEAADALAAQSDAKTEPPSAPEAAGELPSPDAAAAFVAASVAVDRRAFTSTAELMSAARVWCAENEVPVFHPRALAGQLKRRRGVQAHSNGQRRGWRGVKLR